MQLANNQTGVTMRTRGDVGETLIEILFTIVIVSLTFTALFTSLATTGNAGNVQRISVQADVVMRNFAEATKLAAQTCAGVAGATPPSTYNVVFPVPSSTLPPRFTPSVSGVGAGAGVGVGSTCPTLGATQLLKLSVDVPVGPPVTMQIKVITP
jgi:type II secretory pathway pseudopilin PulG